LLGCRAAAGAVGGERPAAPRHQPGVYESMWKKPGFAKALALYDRLCGSARRECSIDAKPVLPSLLNICV